MTKPIIHALVLIQNLGRGNDLINTLKHNKYVISLFHIMGRYSYLLDVNFDTKDDLSHWIDHVKSVTLPSGFPAIISMQTQRIIEVNKQKVNFNLQNYLDMDERFHFFIGIDNPHRDAEILALLDASPVVHSILHVQGDNSFAVEIIAQCYDDYRSLLKSMKEVETVYHIETQEVISVLKYRNQIIDDNGSPALPREDIRELYTL